MSLAHHFDVIIAGAGLAGVAAAAALREFGYRIAVIEPGLDPARRLAGELLHPLGVMAARELGLSHLLESGTPVAGFAVFPTSESEPYCLSYSRMDLLPSRGIVLRHDLLRRLLLEELDRLPYVTVFPGARVVAVKQSGRGPVSVTVSSDGRNWTLDSDLLVGADGRVSKVSEMAGIGRRKYRISGMIGYELRDCPLPKAGYGNVFLAAGAPSLAYEIGPAKVRLIVDIPYQSEQMLTRDDDPSCLAALPEPFRDHVRRGLGAQPGVAAANYFCLPDRVYSGRVVLVGDAAGCSHPLTATGLSACAQDALHLRQGLRRTGGDIGQALKFYAAARRHSQRTRLALVNGLYEVFKARTPETDLLREGIFRYWGSSARGRSTSMALLAACETRRSVLAWQCANVLFHGLMTLRERGSKHPSFSLASGAHTAFRMSCFALRCADQALRREVG